MLKFLVIAVMLQLTQMAVGEEDSPTKEAALREFLLQNYDKRARPSSTTIVNISSVTLLDIDMHEAEHSMTVHSWIHFVWKDSRLAWNLKDHPGIENLGFEADSLWRLDLSVYNSEDVLNYMSDPKTLMLVYPDGKVIYVPPVKLRFFCVMDLTYWPHDSHKCFAKIGSWIHSANQIDLHVISDTPNVNLTSHSLNTDELTYRALNSEDKITVTEWELQDSLIERHASVYPCCEEIYVAVLIHLTVRRNAPAFAWTVKIPAVCLSLLTLVLFLLPPNAGEKMTFGGLCLILHVFFMAYTSHVVAQAPSHTPLIVQLACHQLVVVVVVVVMAALLVRLARNPHCSPPPAFLRQSLLTASSLLCLSNYRDLVTGSKQDPGSSQKSDEVELGERSEGELLRRKSHHQNEWLLLAAVLDRLALILCLLICFVILIRFSSVL